MHINMQEKWQNMEEKPVFIWKNQFLRWFFGSQIKMATIR